MSKKKQAVGAGENSKYLCSQCFTTHYRNDVLFATSRTSRRYDLRQARLRYALHSADQFEDWCRKGKNLVLADWRYFGVEDRTLTNGVVTALRDANGELLRHRVCPQCHCVVLPDMILLAGWNRDGVDTAAVQAMLHSAQQGGGYKCETVMHADLQQVLEYEICSRTGTGMCFGTPVGLENAVTEETEKYTRAYMSGAHAALLTLELKEYDDAMPEMSLNADEAEETADAFFDMLGYVGDALDKPVVVVLNGLPAGSNPQQVLEKRAPALLNRLRLCLKNLRFLAGADDPAANARQALEWIAAQRARIDG